MEAIAPDQDSADWLRDLQPTGTARDRAIARLHALLLRVARGVAARRRSSLPGRGAEEVDDLCVQAANDAVMAVLAKLDTYRGAARFTTWACKFAIFETSSRLRRHAWRERKIELDETALDRLPDAAPPAHRQMENDQLMSDLRSAVDTRLTPRQRMIFQS